MTLTVDRRPITAEQRRRARRRRRRLALLAHGIRVGSMNVRGGFDPLGRLPHLPPADERIVTALHRANDLGITLAAGQEVSTLQADTVGDDPDVLPRWDVVRGIPNDTRTRRLHGKRIRVSLGNATFYRRDEWEVLEVEDCAVEFERGVVSRYRIPKVLHFPVVLFRNKRTGLRVALLAFHFPAGRTRSAQAAKRQCAARIRRYHRESAPFDALFVVAGDRNSAQLLDGWHRVESGVDIVASPDVRLVAPLIDTAYPGLVSDHHNGISGILDGTGDHS